MPKSRNWVLAGIAGGTAVVLALLYWNVPDFLWLQDHPLPAPIVWPLVWVLLATAVMLLVAPRRRSRPVTALVFGVTGLLLLCFGGYRFALNYLRFDDSPDRGELVEHVSSADGRFEVRVLHWQAVLGEDGWDFVVQRRDAVRGAHAYAGCVFRKDYGEIKSVEAGSVHIDFDGDPIDIAFDPETMRVTRRIPENLCRGYG